MTIHSRFTEYGRLIRWDKPIGTLLLLWPTLSALWLAANGQPSAHLLIIFMIGVVITRALGCLINDMVDKNFDKHVDRTRHRPLAQGNISVKEASVFGVVLALIAGSLLFTLNRFTILLAFAGGGMTLLYPWLKRFTYWPQFGLGLTFNWGIILAFSATQNKVPLLAWGLYLIAVLWTLMYDTLYALCDYEDDKKIGIKSTALLFGKNNPLIIATLHIIIVLLLLILCISIANTYWFYMAIVLTAFTFMYQQLLIREATATAYFNAFCNNHWSWFFIFLGIVLNYSS